MSPDEIVTAYPQLCLADVHSALAHYYDHREVIEADILRGRQGAALLRAEQKSILDRRNTPDAGDDTISSR